MRFEVSVLILYVEIQIKVPFFIENYLKSTEIERETRLHFVYGNMKEVSVDYFADFCMCLIPIPLEYTTKKNNNSSFQFISWCVFLFPKKKVIISCVTFIYL